MNAIYVINQGNMLLANSLQSMYAARDRWGIQIIEVEAYDCDLHPASWKLLMLNNALEKGYDRIMILDADTVVSSECPDPFKFFPEHLLTVVTDRQTHAPARDKAEIDEVEIITGQRRKMADYFNSGMVIASTNHHYDLFTKAFALAHKHRHLCWHDQTPFNVVAEGDPRLHYANETWNFLNPDGGRLQNWQTMRGNKFIYHFAGNPDRNQRINETIWK